MKIEHIDELLPLIKDKPEFIVIDKGEYKVIDYVYQSEDTFNGDERLLECRGIKFDRDGKILARPLRKFFNYGERGTELPIHKPHVILDKLDGSMIHPAMVTGWLVLMTRKGVTDVAEKAAKRFLYRPKYYDFMRDMLAEGITPTFEYTGPENRIVLRYDCAELTLLALRHTVTGMHFTYNEILHAAQSYNIPCVSVPEIPSRALMRVDTFVEHARGLIDAEGYVVQFEDGHMVKIKAEDYVMKHRAIDGLRSKKRALEIVLKNKTDDVICLLDEHDKQDMITFRDSVNMEICSLVAKVKRKVYLYGHFDRKIFATEIIPSVHPLLRSAVFRHLDGMDARAAVVQVVNKHPELIKAKWRGE